MLRPTYIVGVGEFGAKVLDMVRLLSYVATRDSTLWGLFRYHRVYWGNTEPGFGFRHLLREPGTEAQSAYSPPGAAPNNRKGIDAAITAVLSGVQPPPPVPDPTLWRQIDASDPGTRFTMLTNLQGGLGLKEVPLSTRREVFLIGDLSELPTSVLVSRISEQVRAGAGALPYGLFFLPVGEGADYAKAFLYELYTSYAPGGTPLFEAVYLAHRPNLGQNDAAQAYTAARFLLLLQTVVDVPGKLVDVDSDEGRGNVVAWALRGVRFTGNEAVFQLSLRTLRDFLNNWIADNASPPSTLSNEAETLLDRLIQKLALEDPTVREETPPKAPQAVPLGTQETLENILREVLWDFMFRHDAPSGPAYVQALLQEMQAKTVEYLAMGDGDGEAGVPSRGLWENWNPGAPVDSGMANFVRLNRWLSPLRSAGLADDVQWQLVREYRTYLAVGKWLQSKTRTNGDFSTPPTVADILKTLNAWRADLNNAVAEIGNALAPVGGVWVNRGLLGVLPGVDPRLVETLTLGPKAEGEPLIPLGNPNEPIPERWRYFTDHTKILLEPFQKLYESYGPTAAGAVPALGGIVGALPTPFLNLAPGAAPQTLYQGWIKAPEGVVAGVPLPLQALAQEIYRRLFPHSHDFVLLRTGIALSDIMLAGDFSEVALANPESEDRRLQRFLKLFVVASFVPAWGAAIGPPRLGDGDGGIWRIDGAGVSLMMPTNNGNVTVFTLPPAPANPGNLLGKVPSQIPEDQRDDLRNFVYTTLVPLVVGDTKLQNHLTQVLGGPGGIGLSELGVYVQREVFGLPFAPTDRDHLVKGVIQALKL